MTSQRCGILGRRSWIDSNASSCVSSSLSRHQREPYCLHASVQRARCFSTIVPFTVSARRGDSGALIAMNQFCYADAQRMEGWEPMRPALCKLWGDAALGYAEFTERPVFQPTPEAPSKFRDRAMSADLSRVQPIQGQVN
jgi:hypothetical protein